MPTSARLGTESAANKTLGGVPTVHYLDIGSKGRGQVIRLFFEDAGIAYDDVRYALGDDYVKFKTTTLASWNPVATVPVVEINGKRLTQSYAILRHFARVLGAYDGKTEDEKYWADSVTDVVIDWRTAFAKAFFTPNRDKDYPEYIEKQRGTFLKGLNELLKIQGGPFVIGKEITYADFPLYQMLHDEGLTKDGRKELKAAGLDKLVELTDAVESRPNIAAFLKSDRYKG